MQNNYTSADHLLSDFSLSQASINTKPMCLLAPYKNLLICLLRLYCRVIYMTTLLYHLAVTIPIYCCGHPLRLYLDTGGFPINNKFLTDFSTSTRERFLLHSIYYFTDIRALLCRFYTHYDKYNIEEN